MDDVQLQFTPERISKGWGVASCGVDADKNFTVLKREHISRPRFSEKPPMQERHSPIGNQPDENFGKLAQVSSSVFLQSQTTLQCITCEDFELDDVYRDFSLKIAH